MSLPSGRSSERRGRVGKIGNTVRETSRMELRSGEIRTTCSAETSTWFKTRKSNT